MRSFWPLRSPSRSSPRGPTSAMWGPWTSVTLGVSCHPVTGRIRCGVSRATGRKTKCIGITWLCRKYWWICSTFQFSEISWWSVGDHFHYFLCPPQVEPHVLRNQRGQLRVQRGTVLLRLRGGPGWLLLPAGRPGTDITGPVPRGQRVQRCLFLHQHLLGLVWQRVWLAGMLLVIKSFSYPILVTVVMNSLSSSQMFLKALMQPSFSWIKVLGLVISIISILWCWIYSSVNKAPRARLTEPIPTYIFVLIEFIIIKLICYSLGCSISVLNHKNASLQLCPLSYQGVTLRVAATCSLTSFRACPVPPVCSPRGRPSPTHTPTATWTSFPGAPWPTTNRYTHLKPPTTERRRKIPVRGNNRGTYFTRKSPASCMWTFHTMALLLS